MNQANTNSFFDRNRKVSKRINYLLLPDKPVESIESLNRIYEKIHFPGSYLHNTLLKEDVIRSIMNKQFLFIKILSSKLDVFRNSQHESIGNGLRSLCKCWTGIESYINGSRDWDSCAGVNNPYLMGDAIII